MRRPYATVQSGIREMLVRASGHDTASRSAAFAAFGRVLLLHRFEHCLHALEAGRRFALVPPHENGPLTETWRTCWAARRGEMIE